MSAELAADDDLIIKSYNTAIETVVSLDKCVDAVINCSSKETEEEESSTKSESGSLAEEQEEPTFNLGDFVRCTYDDGIDYEAKIISINDVKKTCRVKYIGYDNEQTVKIDSLIASWGEEARGIQYGAAMAEKSTSEIHTTPKPQKGFNPPPVPPIPPMLFDCEDEEKNQQFAQLLISWFMTGYYTGLHQRSMQDSKKFKK